MELSDSRAQFRKWTIKSGQRWNLRRYLHPIPDYVGKPADSYERGKWQRSTTYQGKRSRTAQMAAFIKTRRKFHCPRILRCVLIGVKQLPINSKASSASLSKQAAREQKVIASDVSPSKPLSLTERLPRLIPLFVNVSVHV